VPALSRLVRLLLALGVALAALDGRVAVAATAERPRVVVTSDAEIDDQCSLVRFLLYANEWDIEGIVTTSSQYRWQGHKWPVDRWYEPYLAAYAQVQPNLAKHDPAYPTAAFLRARTVLGNAGAEGDMAAPSPGSDLIVRALLDRADPRPVWLQAWGGVNTIARALRTIEERHPERMAEVAAKCRLFLIWEQDDTYQRYIRPVWGKLGLLTIISDQFEAIAYRWKQAQPAALHGYFEGAWMRAHVLRQRGPLTALYHAHENGDFRSEGDSPAFLHTIPTGLRNLESPDWGGWGGRYVRVRENTWLDPVPVPGYAYPDGRWSGENAWGRASLRPESTSTPAQRARYFEPMTRWTAALQNDFAARAAWCVLPYAEANHPPVVALAHAHDLVAAPGATLTLSARGSTDPDGHALDFRWWQDEDADTAETKLVLAGSDRLETSFAIPADASVGDTFHVICEVTDRGTPALTRYRRIVVTVAAGAAPPNYVAGASGAVPIPPPTAHVAFDEARGASAGDRMRGPAGELIGADPALAWIDGLLGGALRLDGRGAHLAVPSHPGIDFAEEAFTVTVWLRWPAGLLPGRRPVLAKGDYDPAVPGESGRRYELYVERDALVFELDDHRVVSRLRVPVKPFVSGRWVHVAAVRDRRAGRLRLYADGVAQPTLEPGNPAADGTDRTGTVANVRPLLLGGAVRSAAWQGDFDDLRFFRAALSPAQIAALAARVPLVESADAAAALAAPAAAAPTALPPLAAHWPLDEGDGVRVRERVAGLAGAVLNADAAHLWTSSDRGLALRLDGVDDRLAVPAHTALDFRGESFSFSCHVRALAGISPSAVTIAAQGDDSGAAAEATPRGWSLRLAGETLRFRLRDGTRSAELAVSAAPLRSGQWVHVVAVCDAGARRLRLYCNGVRQAPVDGADGSGEIGVLPDGLPLSIGANADGAQPFAGEFADLRFYRGALDAAHCAAVSRLRRNAAANPAEVSAPKR
jgi:hypothetical protein